MKTITALTFFAVSLLCFSSVQADSFGSGLNTFDIEFVKVGNPGNVADTTGNPSPPYQTGSVPYTYRIGKYEVSEQMIDKANTMGGLGITKDNRGPDKPATSVSGNQAARFINWLNTSAGSTPAYKFAIQPGEAGYNSNADIQLWATSDLGYNPNNLYRNSQAKYFLPSVDEWYKAAYYDPIAGVYYDYPTGSNSVPDGIDFAGDPNFDAVFFDGGFNNNPNDITNVGVLSPYGTAGQGGNVWEFEETDFDLVNDVTSSFSFRALRGGSHSFDIRFLLSTSRINQFSFGARSSPRPIGLRVASSAIPESSTVLLGALASVGMLLKRRINPARRRG